MQATTLAVEWRGRERFADTWARQLELHTQRAAGAIPDTLVLVEHEHVITLGRQGEQGNLVAPAALLAQQGVDLHRIERGWDITYHGPGQLVGYPITSLRERGLSVHQYVGALEQALISVAARFGIEAQRAAGLNGVWVGENKLAALGVAIRRGVSYHGFALNVSTDLARFNLIVPCGIVGRGVTSLSELLGRQVSLEEVIPVVVEELEQAL